MVPVLLVGAPALVAEALEAAAPVHEVELTAASIDHAAAAMQDQPDHSVTLVYSQGELGWDLVDKIANEGLPVVALLPELDLDQFVRALSSGAGVVALDTSSEIILSATKAAGHEEVLLPLAIVRRIAAIAGRSTPRRELRDTEQAVYDLLVQDMSIDAIASELSYSSRTIRRRMQEILLHFGVRSRDDLPRVPAALGAERS